MTESAAALEHKQQRFIFADMLRAIAALSILAQHYLVDFWTDNSIFAVIANIPVAPSGLMPAPGRWLAANPLPFDLSALGVGLTFMISGFLIPLSIARTSVLQFLWGRICRIVPTYAVGFLATIGALALASRYFSQPFTYSPSNILYQIVPGVRLVVGVPFVDYVVWILEVELCFYLVCAVCAPWLRSSSLLVFIAPSVLLALSFAVTDRVHAVYLMDLSFMFAGVTISLFHRRLLDSGTAAFATVLVLTLTLDAIWRVQGATIAASYAVAALVFAAGYVVRERVFGFAPLRWVAAISYPLYVVQGVMGYVATRILLDFGWSPAKSLGIAASLTTLTAILLHFAVERRSHAYGKRPIGARSRSIRVTSSG